MASPPIERERERARERRAADRRDGRAPAGALRPALIALGVALALGVAIWLAAGRPGLAESESAPASEPTTAVETTPSVASSGLLTDEDVDRLAAQAGSDGQEAVRAFFTGFWRDVQFQNYPGAYETLSDELRREVEYAAFVEGLRQVRWVFFLEWSVHDVERRGPESIIYLRQEPRGELIAFTTRQEGNTWVIAADPANALSILPS